MDKHYKKLSIDFPEEEYTFLKMACAKLGVSIKEFVTKAIITSVEDVEDELDIAALGRARSEVAATGLISWDELEKKLGWDKL